MDLNERLVALLVSRSDRLAEVPSIDRHTVPTLPPVPARSVPAGGGEPANPWEAARAQICAHGVIDATRSGAQLLAALLAGPHATPDELRALLARPGLTDAQRVSVLKHPQTAGSLIVDYICDTRHDAPTFNRAAMSDHVAMLQGIAGVTGEQRLDAWAALLLRVSAASDTCEHTGNVLMSAPDANTVLHAAVALSIRRSRQLTPALGRQLLSHLSLPPTVALLPIRSLFVLLDDHGKVQVSTERIADTFCDMVSAACRTEPRRWERFFLLAPRWDGSIGELLDDVATGPPGPTETRRQRKSVPGYQRPSSRSPLLRPIDYSTRRSTSSGAT